MNEQFCETALAPLSFDDFCEFCLQFLPQTRENERLIGRGYRIEGYRTMADACRFIYLHIILQHVLKENPGFGRLSKRKQIVSIMEASRQYEQSWIDDVPGMREVLNRNFATKK